MVRVDLAVYPGFFVPKINVVPKESLVTTEQVWLFHLEARVIPIILESHDFLDNHGVNDFPSEVIGCTSDADDEVANFCALSYSRFAARQSAYSPEGIGRKPIVP